MPLFLYVLEKIEYKELTPKDSDVIAFMKKIFDKMQLATECIIISLIYLEKVMIHGRIEIRTTNWRPFSVYCYSSSFKILGRYKVKE